MSKSLLLPAAVFLGLAFQLHAQQFQDQTLGTFNRLPAQAVWTESIAAGDIDGDGDIDLVYGKGNGFSVVGTAQQNTILINQMGGAPATLGYFADQTATRLPVQLSNTKDVELLDVDADGDLDLLVANGFGQQPRMYLNNGAGVFSDVTTTHLPVLTLNSFSVIGGDVDNDGDIDLVFTDSGASTFGAPGGQPRLFINDGTGHFLDKTSTQFPVVLIQASVESEFSDVDGDFDLDLFVVSRDASPSKLFVNNGSGTFTAGPVLPSDGSQTYDYSLGDVDGDADADIFIISQAGLAEGVFINNGLGTFAPGGGVVGNLGSDDNVSVLGDIDNDSDFDVAVAALSTAERLFVNNGAGVFTYNAGLITAITDSSLDGAFADVDNDGDLDLLQAIGESGAFQNRIYINVTGVPDSVPPTFRLQALGSSTPAGAIAVRCAIKDVMATKNDPGYQSVTLNYVVNGFPGSRPMKWVGEDMFRGVIPFAPVGAAVSYSVTCVDRNGTSGTSTTVNFSPMVNPASPLLVILTSGVGDITIIQYSPIHPNAEQYLLVSTVLPPVVGSGPLFGLGADAFNIIFYPTGVPPLHDYLDATGLQVVAFGPGSLPPGFAVDARGIILTSPLLVTTNLVRQVF